MKISKWIFLSTIDPKINFLRFNVKLTVSSIKNIIDIIRYSDVSYTKIVLILLVKITGIIAAIICSSLLVNYIFKKKKSIISFIEITSKESQEIEISDHNWPEDEF